MIMFYDTWHRATSSSLESDLFVPVEARNAKDTRHMCKFRFWRMVGSCFAATRIQ